MKKVLCLIAIVVCGVGLSFGQIDMPGVYGDKAVLKQNSEVSIRGWARPTSKVKVVASWNDKDTITVTTANTGKFVAKLKTPQGSFDKHTITFNGDPLMKDVLVGEVWLCSGQSNMEWCVNYGIKDGEKHASEANDDFLRIFNVPLRSAEAPQDDVIANWTTVTPESMRKASAIGYFFGRELKSSLHVPVGIIVSAWGGASVEPFTPRSYIESDTLLQNNAQNRSNDWLDDRIEVMYNGMVNPLLPYAISGAIWYQGESNVPSWRVYEPMLSTMIEAWRERFGSDFPFFMAQIAPFNYNNNKDLNAAWLRYMQERVATNVEKCGMVVLSDLVDDVNNIHPIDKLTPAQRLANLALSEVYGKEGLAYKYPTLKSAMIDGKKAIITFDDLVGDLMVGKNGKAKEIVGLCVIDSEGAQHKAIAKVKGRVLEVTAKRVSDMAEVRYQFDDTTIGNLFSGEALPVAPFSTKQIN